MELSTNQGGSPWAHRGWIALVIAFFALVFPVILFGMDTTSEAHDQNRHHLIVIREGADALAGRDGAPTLGAFIQDYPSATSPGYHLVLSVAQNCGLGNLTLLRMGSSLFGLALLLTLWRLLCERVDGWLAVALALPLLFSPYYLSEIGRAHV